jgi:hypothetical protein
VLVDQRQEGGQGHAPQVGGDHHPDVGEPVDDCAGQRGQQQHRGDLGDDGAGDAQARAVRRNTSTTRATVLKVSPQREIVWAANSRR